MNILLGLDPLVHFLQITCTRFELITQCLRLLNHDSLEQDRRSPHYDKIGKVKGVVYDVRSKFQASFDWV